MHLDVITRGIKHEVDRTMNSLQAQFFPYKYKGKNEYLQFGVRPIQFWELTFPKPCLPDVQKMIWKTNENMETHANMIKTPSMMIRKMLKLDKVPAFDEKIPLRLTYISPAVAFHPVGIKEDVQKDWGESI